MPGCFSVFGGCACPRGAAWTVVHFPRDGRLSAVATHIKTHVVSFLAQFAHRLVRNAAFDFNVSTRSSHLFSGRFVVAFMLPARRVAGFLHVQTEIDLVCEHLGMTLRLHPAAHDY